MDMKLRVNTKTKVEGKLLDLDDEELEPVSPTSEYMLSEVVTLYIFAFFELEVPINFSSTIAFLQDVFVHSHPRLSSIPVDNNKGKKMWKKVTVNVEDHIKVASFSEEISIENYNEQFDNYVSKIATSQLSQHKPLWELHIINCPKGHTSAGVYIYKIHHAIGDGTALMGLIFPNLKRVDDPSLPLNFMSKTTQSDSKKDASVGDIMMNMAKIVPKFISSIIYSLYDFGQGARLAFFEDTKTPIRSGITDMTRPFSSRVCSINFSLIDVKRIKTILGVTVNDIVIGIIFYGTRLYIQETKKGSLKNARATASIMVNLRNGKQSMEEILKEKSWGNKISIMALPLPNFEDVDLNNPLKFIQKVHKIVKAKRSGAYGPLLMGGMIGAIKSLTGIQAASQTFERMWKNSSFCITNLIGPRDQFSIANHPVKGFYFVPTGGNLSLVVSVMSYMENLRVGLVIENGFIDHQRLITCLQNAFQLILEAALATSNDATMNNNFPENA